MSLSQGATARFTLIQGSYWSSYCILISFSSVYLLYQGFQNAQIGALISISSILSALLQPFISRLADTVKRVSLRQFCGGLVLLQLICGILLWLLPGPVPQMLLYGLLLILVQLILPLCSALGMDCLNRSIPLSFGIARGGGSLAFAVLSAVLGTMVLRFGEESLPLALLVFNLILLLSVVTFRLKGAEVPETPSALKDILQEPKAPAAEYRRPFLLRYHRLPLLLFGAICLFISHNVLTIFTYQIVLPLGGGSEWSTPNFVHKNKVRNALL